MPAWLKTHPSRRAELERLTFEAEALWHIARLYCAAIGNDGKLAKADLHVAVSRKLPAARVRRLALELVTAGLWLDAGEVYELPAWLDEQPAAATWNDDTQRERWARNKALSRDRDLCHRIQERDLHLCRYCGIRVNWTDRKGPTGGTYDHVDPDGPNSLDNVVVACRRCNGRKKDRTPEQAGMPLLRAGTDRTIRHPAESGPNLAPIQPDPADRPDSLACARETGPNQTGARSRLDHGAGPEAAALEQLEAAFGPVEVAP